MKSPLKAPILVVLALAALPAAHASAIESVTTPTPDEASEPWVAEYEGEEIDLRFGWETAKACATDGVTTTCYDSEAEMAAALGSVATATPDPSAPAGSSGLLRASCSSYLRLYTGTNYTGSVLALTTRLWVLNLSDYGFNNVTSSYKVGGCSSTFYDLSNAGGTVYGGGSGAWDQAASMPSGWDNRISSVWIA